jgi:hypothetical protein
VIVAVIAFALFWFRPKGPTNEGKTVEEWFNAAYKNMFQAFHGHLQPPSSDRYDSSLHYHCEMAFRGFGTNALSFLVGKINQDMTPSKTSQHHWELYEKSEGMLPKPKDKTLEGYLAADLLREQIKPRGHLLVPLLAPALQSTNSHQRSLALTSLKGINSDRELALPYLMKGLQDPNPEVRDVCADALENYGAAAKPAVSNLVVVADDLLGWVAESALETLAKLGTHAAAAVPALQEMLAKETDEQRRKAIADTLEKIQPPKAAQ